MNLTQSYEQIGYKHLEETNLWSVQNLAHATNYINPVNWPSGLPLNYTHGNHILLEYNEVIDLERNENIGKIDAKGMSGGGIWFLNIRQDSDEIWRPDSGLLAGIQTGFFNKNMVLCGNKIIVCFKFLLKCYPELLQNIYPIIQQEELIS